MLEDQLTNFRISLGNTDTGKDLSVDAIDYVNGAGNTIFKRGTLYLYNKTQLPSRRDEIYLIESSISNISNMFKLPKFFGGRRRTKKTRNQRRKSTRRVRKSKK